MSTLNSTVLNAVPVNGSLLLSGLNPISIDIRTVETGWTDNRAITLASIGLMKEGIKLKPIAVGDDFRIQRTYKIAGVTGSILRAWMTIKKKEKDADASALYDGDVTITPGADGAITDASLVDGEITMYFDLPRAITAQAKPGLTYIYDIGVETDGSAIHTLEKGFVPFTRRVTITP